MIYHSHNNEKDHLKVRKASIGSYKEELSKSDIVYDLYTGTGTIAQFISSNAKKVIGIDSVPEAIKAATESAKNNNIHNCSFFAGDMKNIFSDDFILQNGSPDIIITKGYQSIIKN